jgi:hypothetical protein
LARRACLVEHRGMTKQCSKVGRYVSSAVSEIGRDLTGGWAVPVGAP